MKSIGEFGGAAAVATGISLGLALDFGLASCSTEAPQQVAPATHAWLMEGNFTSAGYGEGATLRAVVARGVGSPVLQEVCVAVESAEPTCTTVNLTDPQESNQDPGPEGVDLSIQTWANKVGGDAYQIAVYPINTTDTPLSEIIISAPVTEGVSISSKLPSVE